MQLNRLDAYKTGNCFKKTLEKSKKMCNIYLARYINSQLCVNILDNFL